MPIAVAPSCLMFRHPSCARVYVQIEKIEEIIGSGQVEELIEIAKDELELIPRYAGVCALCV
jgi:hypothetical protein